MGWRDVNWDWVLFGFRGRLNRKPYWPSVIPMLVLMVFGYIGMESRSDWSRAAGVLLCLLVFWMLLATTAKRLHDRDKSAWWMLIFVCVPMTIEDFGWAFWLVGVPIFVWGLIELECRRGMIGPNRWGPDPVDHA